MNLLDYAPGDNGAAWQRAIDDGAWTQEEFDQAVADLRLTYSQELREYALHDAHEINPVLKDTRTVDLLKLLRPMLEQLTLTGELEEAIMLLGRYELALHDIANMSAVDLYHLNVREGWWYGRV